MAYPQGILLVSTRHFHTKEPLRILRLLKTLRAFTHLPIYKLSNA